MAVCESVGANVKADPCSSWREIVFRQPFPLPLHWFGFCEAIRYHVSPWLVFYSVKIFVREFSLVWLASLFPCFCQMIFSGRSSIILSYF